MKGTGDTEKSTSSRACLKTGFPEVSSCTESNLVVIVGDLRAVFVVCAHHGMSLLGPYQLYISDRIALRMPDYATAADPLSWSPNSVLFIGYQYPSCATGGVHKLHYSPRNRTHTRGSYAYKSCK